MQIQYTINTNATNIDLKKLNRSLDGLVKEIVDTSDGNGFRATFIAGDVDKTSKPTIQKPKSKPVTTTTKKLTDKQIKEIKQLKKTGLSNVMIGNQYGVNESTIRRALKR